jgi:penicillin-binding protein 1C
MRRRLAVWMRRAAMLFALPWAFLLLVAVTMPLPKELETATSESVRVKDRQGRVLREVRSDDGTRADRVAYADLGDHFREALIAVEDRRFRLHPGVDPVAIVRATASLVAHRRIVSGASTLTMQLARAVRPHPRNFAGKFLEAALALRIEMSLPKDRILEEYANRVSFGRGVRGVAAASRVYFGKEPNALSMAEAATLAAIPKGPSVLTLAKNGGRLLARRDRVLARLRESGALTPEEHERARVEPLPSLAPHATFGAAHFVEGCLAGTYCATTKGKAEVSTTLDGTLQGDVEYLVGRRLDLLEAKHVSQAAVVVLDNASGELLAYVGSRDYDDVAAQGRVDGARALRQPGSSLKPFVYALGIETRRWSPATMFEDVETSFPNAAGEVFWPKNYDGRFHGPTRLREALGNSYNVPAVQAAAALGESALVEWFGKLGLGSFSESPNSYGPAIALGDGEVRLVELANAYATLARRGMYRPVRGDVRMAATEHRVVAEETADLVNDVLADPSARRAAFGASTVLDFDFPVAAKTGTSKHFRDNVTVGYTPEVTVAVWAGNFDGSPMLDVSGISGAGPIFHDVMLAAMRARPARPFARSSRLREVQVCVLSGGRPNAGCRHRVAELVLPDALPAPCSMHGGERDGDHSPRLAEWARGVNDFSNAAHRERRPTTDDRAPVIRYPHADAHFSLDHSRPTKLQAIYVGVDVRTERPLELFVDGALYTRAPVGDLGWVPSSGVHELVVVADGRRSNPVRIKVD